MKKIIILLAFVFAQFATAQTKTAESVQIGKIAPLGAFSISIDKYPDYYMVSFKDQKYKELEKTARFSLFSEKEFEDFYSLIMTGFDSLPKDDLVVELSEGSAWLHFEKNMGVTSLQIKYSDQKNYALAAESSFLTKKQVTKLFGKK